jgi:endoglucanase
MKNTKLYLLSALIFMSGNGLINSQSWIRINQLGYLPGSIKVAVLVSKEYLQPTQFELHDAISDDIIFISSSIKAYGKYGAFNSTYRLDFSSLNQEGAYYISASGIKSPVFKISADVYDGTADFLLRYMRQQRCGYNPFLHDSCHTHDGYIIYHPVLDSTHIDVTGGWHDATDYLQYTATSANAVFQMLLAYKQNPSSFKDNYISNGEPGKNGIPDIIDEVIWGTDWLVKMNPDSGQMYNQLADDRDHKGFRLPNKDTVSYGKGLERPVYFCTGKQQGVFKNKNRATGIASTAGKFASAFAFASIVLKEFNAGYSEMLKKKAINAWFFGKANPGACQTAPCVEPYFYEEDNWTDDMELAGAMLFQLTGNYQYLDDAAYYGRMEKVTPWMGADTARHYQWYPFLNMGHWGIGITKDKLYSDEFLTYWSEGINRVYQRGFQNPFLNGIPFIWCSNNLTVAMITQCHLYAKLTGNHIYDDMEAALRDWLFGCNPWGTSMVIGLPEYGDYPADPHSSLSVLKGYRLDGGLIDGPVYNSIFKNLKGLYLSADDEYKAFQSDVAVYHDDHANYATNEPTMDGTADFTYYLSAMQAEAHGNDKISNDLLYDQGAIIRGNRGKKQLSLVFTGHDLTDGFKRVKKVLKKNQVKASFFLTGDFYRNDRLTSLINGLKKDGHYLGGHSDKHLLYCDWNKRDSLLVTKQKFITDLKNNYAAMHILGINTERALYFLPPYEWYNDSIAAWCDQMGLKLINFTPGTSSNQDWTYPEQGYRYISSNDIYKNIMSYETEKPDGLNGFLLLVHAGTDRRRPDKFYNRLGELIKELKQRGYQFATLQEVIGK